MDVMPSSMTVHHIHAGAHGTQKRELDTLELVMDGCKCHAIARN